MLLIIIHYALFSLTLILTKLILKCCGSIFYIGARFGLAGALMMAYQYAWTKERFHIKKEHFWIFTQITVFGIYITYIIRFWGFQFMDSAKTMFLFNLAPFATALFSYFLLNERMSRKQWIGLFIGFIGFIPILMTSSSAEKSAGEAFLISWPEIAVLASVVSQSYTWILIRILMREASYSSTMINGLSMFIGGIGALLTAPFFEGIYPVTNTMEFLVLLILVTVIGSIVCQNLYAYLLTIYTATMLSFAGFVSPFFAAFYGWLWLNETTTWQFYASSIIVFIGLWLFYQDELKYIQRSDTIKVSEVIES
jgi:drug/metabolite transporter (DMT)-like permease